MAEIVMLGTGLRGTLMSIELTDKLAPEDRLTLTDQDASYRFVPSNSRMAVGSRKTA